jgi:hypothetical protein
MSVDQGRIVSMSLYSYPDSNAESLIYVALCDVCKDVRATPTNSGFRLPDGWTTYHGPQRADTCSSHPVQAPLAYDGASDYINSLVVTECRRALREDASRRSGSMETD